jgi:hypothetical protein
MSKRELLALMAAAIWPHVQASNSVLSTRVLAVNVARDLLAEVERQIEAEGA